MLQEAFERFLGLPDVRQQSTQASALACQHRRIGWLKSWHQQLPGLKVERLCDFGELVKRRGVFFVEDASDGALIDLCRLSNRGLTGKQRRGCAQRLEVLGQGCSG